MMTVSCHYAESPATSPCPESIAHQLSALQNDLLSHAYHLTKDSEQAWDLLQDTMERTLRFEHRFELGTNLKAWAHQILRNLFISACRRRKMELHTLRDLSTDPDNWTTSQGQPNDSHKLLSEDLQHGINSLTPTYRATIWLIDIQGYSYRDAALRMAVPLGTIMSRLHRARQLLAVIIKNQKTAYLAA